MKEMTFRRGKANIICSHAIFTAISMIFFGIIISDTNWFQVSYPKGTLRIWWESIIILLVLAVTGPMSVQGYDMIRLDEEGITVTKASIFKKKRTQEFLAWNDVRNIILSGGRGGAHICVYRFDKSFISFEYTKKRYVFIRSMFHGEMD